jgi:hypothetical protein
MSETQKQSSNPLFRTARRLVDTAEDLLDDTLERGKGMEKDARKLIDNALRDRAGSKKGSKRKAK